MLDSVIEQQGFPPIAGIPGCFTQDSPPVEEVFTIIALDISEPYSRAYSRAYSSNLNLYPLLRSWFFTSSNDDDVAPPNTILSKSRLIVDNIALYLMGP